MNRRAGLGRPGTGPRPRYRRGPLRGPPFSSGLLAPSRCPLRRWLRPPQRAETLVRRVPEECFEPEADGLGVGGGATHRTSLREQPVVDV